MTIYWINDFDRYDERVEIDKSICHQNQKGYNIEHSILFYTFELLMVILNRTVFDIPLTWDRIRFEATRNKYRIARKLIEISINGKSINSFRI